jgi:hypothetical protein
MYEMRLERSLHACLRQLAKLKKEQEELGAAEEVVEDASEQNEAKADDGSAQVLVHEFVIDTPQDRAELDVGAADTPERQEEVSRDAASKLAG